jgi:hypothetical protein
MSAQRSTSRRGNARAVVVFEPNLLCGREADSEAICAQVLKRPRAVRVPLVRRLQPCTQLISCRNARTSMPTCRRHRCPGRAARPGRPRSAPTRCAANRPFLESPRSVRVSCIRTGRADGTRTHLLRGLVAHAGECPRLRVGRDARRARAQRAEGCGGQQACGVREHGADAPFEYEKTRHRSSSAGLARCSSMSSVSYLRRGSAT